MTAGAAVSVVLRVRERDPAPCLRALAAQRLAASEVLVVGAHAGARDAITALARELALPLAFVGGTHADASGVNRALAQARGDYFCVLDDSVECAPHHIASLLDAARAQPQALLWYARSCVIVEHAPPQAFGRAFNRALFHHDRLFDLAAALIDRRVLDLGCAFDTTLDDGDQDFLKQVAAHGGFFFAASTPAVVTLRPRAAPTGAAATVAAQREAAKWAGERHYHTLRSSLLCTRARERLEAGAIEQARDAFDAARAAYPGDPDALHGMARCELALGRAAQALHHVLAALELDPHNAAYLDSASQARARLGAPAPGGTAVSAWLAGGDWLPRGFAIAAVPAQGPPPAQQGGTKRGAACPCGSALRFKHCCGSLSARRIATDDEPCGIAKAMHNAQHWLRAGEAEHAAAILGDIAPAQVGDAELAFGAGESCLELHDLGRARALLQRALELDPAAGRADAALARCLELELRPQAWRSAADVLRAQLQRLERRATARAPRPRGPLHIVCRLDALGGTERRALNLYRTLAAHGDVTLWSTTPALAEYQALAPIRCIDARHAPDGGTLLLTGSYFDCGAWLENAPFERVAICHNLTEQYPSLIERLIQLEHNPSRPHVALSFPSQLFREACGLPGAVEYSAVDTTQFRRCSARGDHAAPLVVGRHGRAHRLKFHPNDPAFFRQVLARGHRVRLLGGSAIAGAFAAGEAAPALLPAGAETARAFLETLDVFVYRKHPAFVETGGTAILEAMAMELPVVVFTGDCGVAELIEHGANGLLVDNESEALAAIDRLAADATLRQRLGQAARHTVVALMRQQEAELVARYLDGTAASRATLTA